MGKPKPPDGIPAEVEFCKRRFVYQKTENRDPFPGIHVYKLDHVLIFVRDDPGEPGPYFDVQVCATSKDHIDRIIAAGSASKIEQAVKRAEKDFQAMYYKIKHLMER